VVAVPRIVIIAGEASGDQLGRGLIEELRANLPGVSIEGVTGPQMRAAGCESWADYEPLAVMGLFEVLRHLPRILRFKRMLQKRLLENPPDLLIGIDAPDFNLRLETFARRAGIKTVHYVCPSVWAWRQSRVKTLRAACDLVLCLLPFERDFVSSHGVNARFVGHPLANEIKAPEGTAAGREQLGLAEGPMIALLPGSRRGELKYLLEPFLDAAHCLQGRVKGVQFALAAATPALAELSQAAVERAGLQGCVRVVTGRTRDVLAAADSVLLASGTATLETMLMLRPMVVAYRVSGLTAWLLRKSGLVKVDLFSLPNLLAGRALVPELLQEQANGEELCAAVAEHFSNPSVADEQVKEFAAMSGMLRQSASRVAAEAVVELLQQDQ